MIDVTIRPQRVYLEQGENTQQLNCDFLLESRSALSLRIDTIEVSVFDAQGRLVVRRALDSNALNPSIATIGTTALAPGEALTVFNPFHTFPADLPLHRLRYRFVLTDVDGRPAEEAEAEVAPIRYETKADLILPLRGRLIVRDGHDFYAHHRRVALTHPLIRELGVEALSGRYAYDFDVVDAAGALHRGDGTAYMLV